MPEIQIPVQPVENPILCSPYQEPDQHWLYDTKTGIPSKTPGRRPASYWLKTERTCSAQMSLLAEKERDDLPPFFALLSFPAYCIITQTEELVRSELWNFGFSAHHAARS